MADEPFLISVIIPTYNAANYLPEAIESVLSQKYPNIEIIIIDDGSTDNTVDVLKPYSDKIVYHYQDNGGPAAARNYGLQIAQGEIMAFLDADDLWPEDKLERQLSHLKEFPDAEIVVGRQRVEYLPNAKELLCGDELATEAQVCQSLPVALARRTAFDKIGYFDTELIYSEDWDWFLRAREMNIKILAYDEVTNIHRRHAANMTHDVHRLNRYICKMFQKSLKRRRQNPDIKAEFTTFTELEKKINP